MKLSRGLQATDATNPRIRPGSSPSECTSTCPQTLQEAKPKAGTIRRRDRQSLVDTDRRRELKPRSQSDRTQIQPLEVAQSSTFERSDHPTKINRGARSDEQARGPGRSEMTAHPMREQTCEGRLRTPGALPNRAEGRTTRIGQAAKARIGSGTPRPKNATVHDRCRAANEQCGGA
jgi:hypothetical protein